MSHSLQFTLDTFPSVFDMIEEHTEDYDVRLNLDEMDVVNSLIIENTKTNEIKVCNIGDVVFVIDGKIEILKEVQE